MSATRLQIDRPVLAEARQRAAEFRDARSRAGTLVVNLLSSPGAGKTSLLEAVARHWRGRHTLAVLVGDLATDRDAERLAPLVPALQLTTGGACHLEMSLVERGWSALAATTLDFLFIENVGNLVCPASFDLGEHVRIVVTSTPEGDDKPAKYPKVFRTSQVLVINKIDLLPYVPYSFDAATRDARSVQPQLDVLTTAARSGEGIAELCAYLEQRRQRMLAEQRLLTAQAREPVAVPDDMAPGVE
ncbi:MAG: hydrogenase nickel incorporation protein HypB [Pirellulales bacterium]|nr:hydrogenase nickel incorporation protein HypB [Pirellulales bacterium]